MLKVEGLITENDIVGSPRWIRGTLARTALVMLLAGIGALLVHNLALFVSCVGSLLGVPLAFVFPSLIHLKVAESSQNVTKINYLVIGGGTVMCIAATSVTIATA